MKYLNLLIITILLYACSKDEGIQGIEKASQVQLDEIIFSGCKGENAAFGSNENILIEPLSNNKIKVTHQNVMFNCCIDEPTIKLNTNGNTIQVEESTSDPVCNCICPYDVEFVIDSLELGTYNFVLTYENLQKVKLSFKMPLKESLHAEI